MSIIGRMEYENRRIDLHSHSIFSDGDLLPSEMLRRVSVLDYRAHAITDHADASNMAEVISSLRRVLDEQPNDFDTQLIVGIELTHVAPNSIARLARQARLLGAEIVVVHGETPVEPVAPGTNRAAIESPDVDVLAHPGFLTLEEAYLAAERGCFIEITARKGHSLTNGHVAQICTEAGAAMVLDSDGHSPSDLITFEMSRVVAAGAGLNAVQVYETTVVNPHRVLARVLDARKSS